MSRRLSSIPLAVLSFCMLLSVQGSGQETRTPSPPASPAPATAASASAAPAASTDVVIERVAVKLRDPASYQTPLILGAARSMTVRARTDGVVSSVLVKPGDKVQKQSELVRLDSTERQKLFQQAQTNYKLAQLGETAAAGADREPAALRAAAAKIEVEVAQLRLDDMVLRSPLEAEVHRIHVTEGEFVLAGAPLVDIADPSQLVVEIPVDRRHAKSADTIKLTVEDQSVDARIAAILPAAKAFAPLRDLFESVASASIAVDNSAGKLSVGQSVTSTMIPRNPVVEVPNSALVNGDAGTRKVQVIREGFVRDVPIDLLGAVGELHSFVSGRFAEGDEVVVRTSTTLVDGSWVRPKLEVLQQAASPAVSTPANTGTRPPTTPAPTRSNNF